MSTGAPSAFERVAIVRFNGLFFALSGVLLAASAYFGWQCVGAGHSPMLCLQMLFLSAMIFVMLVQARWTRRRVPVSVGVGDDHLLVDGASVCPLRAISSVYVVPADGKARTVRLLRRLRPAIELWVRNEEHAVALMRALRVGPTQWAASYRLPYQGGWRGFPISVLTVGAMMWIATRAGDASLLLGPVSFFLGIVMAAIPVGPLLMVGTDGISLASMGRTRFVPYGDIADVKAAMVSRSRRTVIKWWRIRIMLTTGEVVRFFVRPGRVGVGDTYAQRGLDAQRIAESIWEARSAAISEADAPSALLRASGTAPARIRALRALGRQREDDYRTAPVSTEQLWQTFENTAVDPEARAGAAIALRARLDEPCRQRLRVVAAATVAPKLRVAIESAAGDDDDALEEALTALESDVAADRAVRPELV
jgi:hypothetical protein